MRIPNFTVDLAREEIVRAEFCRLHPHYHSVTDLELQKKGVDAVLPSGLNVDFKFTELTKYYTGNEIPFELWSTNPDPLRAKPYAGSLGWSVNPQNITDIYVFVWYEWQNGKPEFSPEHIVICTKEDYNERMKRIAKAKAFWKELLCGGNGTCFYVHPQTWDEAGEDQGFSYVPPRITESPKRRNAWGLDPLWRHRTIEAGGKPNQRSFA